MTSIAYEELSAKRKREQSEGVLPEWMETAGYDLFCKSYLWEANNWNEQIKRIAVNLARHAPKNIPLNKYGTTWADIFYTLINQNIVVLATPTLANNGTKRGLSVSCAGQYIGDSINSFYSNLHEAAILSKLGFGTSGYFGDIRPRGSSMSAGGQASGAYPVLEDFWTMASKVSQGSARRGSFAGYIPIDHKDYEEIIHKVKVNPDGKHLGVTISRDIARAIADKTSPSMVHRFQKLIELRMMGRGYIQFTDNVDDQQPEMYKKHGLKNHASNLCVSGSTNILTKDGYKPIETLAGKTIECWNGKEWSNTPIFKTHDGQKVLEVALSNGQTIKATPYHKWYVATFDNHYGVSGEIVKRTHELQIGDKLVKYDLEPVTHGTKELEHAYTNGLHTAEGTMYLSSNKPRISLYGDKQKLLNRLTGYYSVTTTATASIKDTDRINVTFKADVLQPKFFVPDTSYSVKSRLEWLAGLFDGDGTLTNNNGTESIQLASTEEEFLRKLHLMLQELGIDSKVAHHVDAGYRKLPANDGTEDLKEFWCKEAKRILIAGSQLKQLLALGYVGTRVMPTVRNQNRQATQYVKVLSVTNNDEVLPTYCGTEPKEHKLMFNGVLTGNCNEILLHADEDHTYSCVIGSMNASTYSVWKGTNAVFLAQVLLDCMVSDFLEEAQNIEGMEKIIRATTKGRAVGLGITGLHTYMQANEMVFGSFDSMMFNNEIYGTLRTESDAASKWLATELGEPLWCVGSGYRNTHRLAQMPNKSSSLLFGQVSEGINPIVGNVFNQRISTGEVFRINPNFIKLLKSKNKFNDEVLASVSAYHGSVQHLDFLSIGEKELYRTAFEIPQMDVISMAEQRQKYIDQGQSLNLYLPQNVNSKFVAELHVRALSSDILKGMYYINTANADYEVIQTCSSCES